MNAVLKDPLLRLRPMVESDLVAVLAVEEAGYSHPWTVGIFRDCLRVGYCCWVYELGDEIIGHGIMSVAAGECHVLNICVHPRWQGHGLGRRILRRLLNIGRQHHADTAFLEVRVSNRAAVELYLSSGFNEVGRRRGYYPGSRGREDALVFACDLSS
jgi:ribosomal-protein-alanine N-acetyltransferase